MAKKKEPKIEPMRPLRTTKSRLSCILSAAELKEKGFALASTVQEIGQEEAAQKLQRESMKARLSQLAARKTELANAVASGKEYRDVDVNVMLDGATVHEVRTEHRGNCGDPKRHGCRNAAPA